MSLVQNDFLKSLGWNDFFASHWQQLDQNLLPARVIAQEKGLYRVQPHPDAPLWATLAGRFRNQSVVTEDLPSVGDWVAVSLDGGSDRAMIHHVFPRQTCMMRKMAGGEYQIQIIASNINTLLIATSMNEDLNPRRLERYLTLGWDSGAVPVLLLTKADLVPEAAEVVAGVAKEIPGVDVHGVTVEDLNSISCLSKYFAPGQTAAMVGSSGVGKSTLINHLIGREVLRTQGIREDDGKGRHTTTARYLFATKWGGLIIDTPGMRELQLADNEEGLERSFSDVEELALKCRFRDCAHKTEPGCAIQGALKSGALTIERWDSYLKLLAELRHFQRKTKKVSQKNKIKGR